MNKRALRVRVYATKEIGESLPMIEKIGVPVDAVPAVMLMVPDSGCLVADVVEVPTDPNS